MASNSLIANNSNSGYPYDQYRLGSGKEGTLQGLRTPKVAKVMSRSRLRKARLMGGICDGGGVVWVVRMCSISPMTIVCRSCHTAYELEKKVVQSVALSDVRGLESASGLPGVYFYHWSGPPDDRQLEVGTAISARLSEYVRQVPPSS